MELVAIPNPDYRSHPAYGGFFGSPSFIDRARALRRFIPRFAKIIRKIIANPKKSPGRLRLSADQKRSFAFLEAFIRDGAVPFKLESDEKNTLVQAAAIHINALRERKHATPVQKRRFEHKVALIPKDNEGERLYSAVFELLDRMRIFEGAGLYRGYKLGIRQIFAQVGDPEDHDWRDHFADIGFKDPKTSYMHFDSKIQVIKCLIYLNKVGFENGPTCYVLGSNRFGAGLFEYITRKANDISRLDLCDPANRRLFNALPSFLQKKSEFGNDLLDTDPLSQELLRREKRFTSEDGDMFLIDTDGVHRGGMVLGGERQLLQVVLGKPA